MVLSLLFIALLGSTPCGHTKLTEWPITWQNGIQPPVSRNAKNSAGYAEPGGVPVVDPPFHSAGYLELNNTYDARLFYFYFQERNKDPNAPLLFWTNGGPGCSSLFGLFMENGPYAIQEDLTLRWTEFGWDQGQNILYVDQPVGTGFSRTGDDRDYARFEDTVGEDMLVFFLEFMALHPELHGNDLYLSGESYAGHYLPAIADAISEANKKGDFMQLNLKGVFVGNPWTSPLHIYFSYPDFAEFHGFIGKELADGIRMRSDECSSYTAKCNEEKTMDSCSWAKDYCRWYFYKIIKDEVPEMNKYDIRKKCLTKACYNETLLIDFLNLPSTQEQLGVNKTWMNCDHKIKRFMHADKMIDMGPTVVKLLGHGLRYMVYVGDQDFIANWMGNKAWIDSMVWNKSDEWTGSLSPWIVDTKYKTREVAGECETVEPLTFCKVYQSGHMVPMDQPEHAYHMLQTFLSGANFGAQEYRMSGLESTRRASDVNFPPT